MKDAKMTISDKLSWIGGMMGLFTGFSVISGIEILYWIIFKIICRKQVQVETGQKTDDVCEDCKANYDEQLKKQDERIQKQEEKFDRQEEKFQKQEEELKFAKNYFEMMQLKSKHSEFEDSKAGAFFDAIFSDIEAQNNK